MSDTITVNVDDLRTAITPATRQSVWMEVAGRLRAALAEHDKAEQERLGRLVFMEHEDDWTEEQLRALLGISLYVRRGIDTPGCYWWQITPLAVDALGTFFPHQTDHAYQGSAGDICGVECISLEGVTYYCTSPEWAHTPPAVPDWQTDPDVLVVEDRFGEQWGRHSAFAWMCFKMVRPVCAWQDLQDVRGPITPVGWRRDPDSIVIPKSELNDEPSEWWRHYAVGTFYPEVFRQVFAAIADALEADHA